MSRKNHHRDYNGRQGSAQRPWEQEQADRQNRGSMQRNQYDNIGRDRYGPNTGQGGGYGSRDWAQGEEGGARPNWPDQDRTTRQGQGNSDARFYGQGGYDRSEEENESYGRDSGSRRYRSQGYGSDQGMSRYQSERSGGYGQNYGDSDNQGGSYRQRGGQGEHSGKGPKGYRRGDERIQEDINEQLTHHPEIDAGEIEVKVSHGEVTLTGTVDNREAKRQAEDIAESVSGVTDVQNQIRVQKTVGAASRNEEEESSSSRSRTNRSGSGVGA